jgi:D-serine deaminase-like pyridoxal phosphate-dependent protein
MADVETCTRFSDTDVSVDWEQTTERYAEILLTTHDRIMSPELMGVLSDHDAVIELQTSHGRYEKSEWLVALPVE